MDIPDLIKPGPSELQFYYQGEVVGIAHSHGSHGYSPSLPKGFSEKYPNQSFKTSLMLTDDKVPRGILIEDA